LNALSKDPDNHLIEIVFRTYKFKHPMVTGNEIDFAPAFVGRRPGRIISVPDWNKDSLFFHHSCRLRYAIIILNLVVSFFIFFLIGRGPRDRIRLWLLIR
jgi:hypothetical protein